ncbi:MAG TPA: hypothetical protein VIC60_00760, partial [Thermomicrobiales bacterium]
MRHRLLQPLLRFERALLRLLDPVARDADRVALAREAAQVGAQVGEFLLDLRGMRAVEIDRVLDRALNDAVLSSMPY